MNSLNIQLEHRPWIVDERPFPHILVPRLFKSEFADALSQQVRCIIRNPHSMRHFGWYDAYTRGFEQTTTGPLSVFISAAWHDLIADIMRIPATRHINGGIHHHPPGTANGFVHNDLNPVYFDRDPGDGVALPAHDRVSYTQGTVLASDARPRRVVRCTALLYYVANPPWRVGDGGETGLYARLDDAITNAIKRIPPINNSMLVFNCAPISFHAFLRNRTERNCVVMWLHAEPEHMGERFGYDSFVEFADRD